jgi:hypothetical protein
VVAVPYDTASILDCCSEIAEAEAAVSVNKNDSWNFVDREQRLKVLCL